MENIDLSKLDQKTALLKSSKINRFLQHPLHMTYSKGIEYFSNVFKKNVKRKATTFWGDDIEVVFPEMVSMSIYKYGLVEEELTRIVLSMLKPGMIFFDIGAHFGYYSSLAAKIVGETGHVYSFEPTPATFNILKKNIQNKKNISPINAAVYSHKTEIKMKDYGFEYSAFNSIYEGNLLPENKRKIHHYDELSVKALSIDDFVKNEKTEPDFVKIDAEKAELDILIGMENTLLTSKPVVTLEVGDIEGTNQDTPSRKLVEHMVSMNYQCLEYAEGKFVKHIIKDSYFYDNLLFIPE